MSCPFRAFHLLILNSLSGGNLNLIAMKKTACNSSYRVDIEFVEFSELTKFQSKLNTWITSGTLIKYQSCINDKGVLFEVVRKKGA